MPVRRQTTPRMLNPPVVTRNIPIPAALLIQQEGNGGLTRNAQYRTMRLHGGKWSVELPLSPPIQRPLNNGGGCLGKVSPSRKKLMLAASFPGILTFLLEGIWTKSAIPLVTAISGIITWCLVSLFLFSIYGIQRKEVIK